MLFSAFQNFAMLLGIFFAVWLIAVNSGFDPETSNVVIRKRRASHARNYRVR